MKHQILRSVRSRTAVFILGAPALGFPLPGSAQGNPLTLTEAVTAALAYHPTAARGRAGVESAQAGLAPAIFGPWMNASGSVLA